MTLKTSSDAKLALKAIRDRWPVPEATRVEMVAALLRIVESSPDDRAKVAAARALIEADKINMEQEKRDLGIPDRVDVTSGGKIFEDLRSLSDEELRSQIEALEAGA